MSEQGPIHADLAADPARANGRDGQHGTESDLERFGLGPEDQDPADDDATEILSGADATQERDSSLNRFGLGPEE
jgi:hypothetical protein